MTLPTTARAEQSRPAASGVAGTHPDRVGRHVVSEVPVARPDESVADVLQSMRGASLDYAGAVYVVNTEGRLVGQVALPAVLASPGDRGMDELMVPVTAVVTPETDQEHAATIAIGHRLAAVPVADANGRLIGVVPPEVLMEVLRAEHLEDLHHLSGVRRDEVMARQAIEGPPLRRARNRLPWLLIGLGGSALVTGVMALFESALETTVAVAFFVPGIVYLADAIGTQTEAAAVRGLSLVHEPLRRLVWGELRTGLVMGVTLAAIALPGAWMFSGDPLLAIAVAGALLAAGAVATTVGLLLPWLLAHVGRDPAYGSGPLATVVQDLLSILIYLAMVSALLP